MDQRLTSTPRLARGPAPEIARLSATLRRPALGWHVLAEFYDCGRLPSTADELGRHMVTAAERIGATIVESVFHEFNPYGLSGVVVIAESHLAIHTWPEYQCAAVDLFTCNRSLAASAGLEYLCEAFEAGTCELIEVPRGGRLPGTVSTGAAPK